MGLVSRRLFDAFGLSESLCTSKHIVAGVCTSKLGIGTDPSFLGIYLGPLQAKPRDLLLLFRGSLDDQFCLGVRIHYPFE